MKLYLTKQVLIQLRIDGFYSSQNTFLLSKVREKAFARFGGAEGLQAEISKRESRKWAEATKKTKGALSRKE